MPRKRKERTPEQLERREGRQAKRLEVAILKAMPYKDYLKTEHWQRIRRRALKTARGHCQVCNASNVVLDVHHRTYERKGREYRRDVIVLCRPCHDVFHKNRAIAT